MKSNSPKVSKTCLDGNEDDFSNTNTNAISTSQNSKKTPITNNNKANIPIQTDHSNLSLIDLVNSLKDKISVYESEIHSLRDEKVRMQIEINNLMLINNYNKDLNKKFLSSKDEQFKDNQLIELNKQIANEQPYGLKKEMNYLNNAISKQKEMITDPKFVSSLKIDKCPNCEAKNEELRKLTEEKSEICSAIQELKIQLDEMKKQQNVNNVGKNKKKKNKEKIDRKETLPNIEQYFILNNKFQLVDSDRNLWHMKKCLKFQQFKEEKKNEYSTSEEILKAFVDVYEIKSDEEGDDEDKDSERNNKEDK